MFVWTDPSKPTIERDTRTEPKRAVCLVSARWLAVDSILHSLILDPEGAETRGMMRRDLRLMYATGLIQEFGAHHSDAYQDASGVLNTWKKSLSR
jgi:hypothetical protein